MAISNRERVGKGLDHLATGLRPFVERELSSQLGDNWQSMLSENAPRSGRAKPKPINLDDPQTLLGILWDQWNAVFKNTLGHSEQSLVSELHDVRNHWAHNEQFSSNDAIRALDSMERLLNAVSAADSAGEVGQMRMDLMRSLFDEQRRSEMRKKAFQPTEGKPQGGLKPWREVVTPHPDVASGRYQQAEFAADLWQVYQGEGSDEYKHPTEFFRRTFLTEGLRRCFRRPCEDWPVMVGILSWNSKPTSVAARPTPCWHCTTCFPVFRLLTCRGPRNWRKSWE
ncbi:MAG UNVERIFIED_CONTAM: hypothetical protein LVR18_12155 [Planctomycetaceae bacterium]|jgi:hypothetical protein